MTLVADGSTWVDPDDWDGDTVPDFHVEPQQPVESDELEALFTTPLCTW
jgi:hypothetical protein